jgi:hypothetical protein
MNKVLIITRVSRKLERPRRDWLEASGTVTGTAEPVTLTSWTPMFSI